MAASHIGGWRGAAAWADVDGASFDGSRCGEEDDLIILSGLPVESGDEVVEEDRDLDAGELVAGAEARPPPKGAEDARPAALLPAIPAAGRPPTPGIEAPGVGIVRWVHVNCSEGGKHLAALGDGVPSCVHSHTHARHISASATL